MENNVIFGILGLTCCICIFLGWYFSHKARHRERLLMIEKGMDPDVHNNERPSLRRVLLKIGVVVIGLGIGLGIIGLLAEFGALGNSGSIPVGILTLCGGAALIIANRLPDAKK